MSGKICRIFTLRGPIRVAATRCNVLPSPFVPYGREGARKEDAQAFMEFDKIEEFSKFFEFPLEIGTL